MKLINKCIEEHDWKLVDDTISSLELAIKELKNIKKTTHVKKEMKKVIDNLKVDPETLSENNLELALKLYERYEYTNVYEQRLWFWHGIYNEIKKQYEQTPTDTAGHSDVQQTSEVK